jgi:sulfide dehydrogenase cytochrome subunit
MSRSRDGAWAVAMLMVIGAVPAAAQTEALAARNLAATCANCEGRIQGDVLPVLAGRPAAEIEAALAEFRAGRRQATVMDQIARGYSEAQSALVAGYFAALPPVTARRP